MAATTFAEYLAQRATGLAIANGTYDSGMRVMWGDKIRGMGAGGINAVTTSDIIAGWAGGSGTIAERERTYWTVNKGVPAGTIADMRQYAVANSLTP